MWFAKIYREMGIYLKYELTIYFKKQKGTKKSKKIVIT